MKKILLISNYVFHYREKVYNYFSNEFKANDYELVVMSNAFQEAGIEIEFSHIEIPLTFSDCKIVIQKEKPDVVILFLHLKDYCMIPTILYCKKNNIPVIYWNHGINIADPNSKFKNFIFHRIHDLCDALITYSPDFKKYFSSRNQDKLFVAYNTLNFRDIRKENYSVKTIKKKYDIGYDKCVLFAARINPSKRLDILVGIMKQFDNAALIIVGPGLQEEISKDIENVPNIFYFGARYGEEMNEFYSIADVFCIPQYIGLAMNEALFWNVPTCLMDGRHGPEVYYMKDKVTGFIAKDEDELKKDINILLTDEAVHEKMVEGCKNEYEAEVDIQRMFAGFMDAIKYCEEKR